jgi:hypothetical protein
MNRAITLYNRIKTDKKYRQIFTVFGCSCGIFLVLVSQGCGIQISKSYPIYPVMCGIHTVQSVRIFESSSGHVFQDMLCYIR